MSAAALRPDGETAPDVGERITRLFPKCRPRNMHQHHDRLNSSLESRTNVLNNAALSSDEERRGREGADNQLVILNSKSGAYKLRDSRIIEIAGGRELYSQSRTKAARKLRHSATHKHNLRNKARTLSKDTIDYVTDNLKTEISLHRLNNESKKMISRHMSSSYTNGDKNPNLILENSMGIPKNSSPILDPHKAIDISSKVSSPIAVVADGEVMVFDDNEDWKGLRVDADVSDNEIDVSVRRTIDNLKNGDSDLMNNRACSRDASESGGESGGESAGGSDGGSEGERPRVTRVIGELAIAEYEGSPRRYGPTAHTAPAPTAHGTSASRSPRPGFPQRVVTESRDVTPPSGSAAFDYLYEFSETRKVLEEFFRCPAGAGHTQLPSGLNDEIVNFQWLLKELDYSLRRQTAAGGGSDAGSEEEALASPHAVHNHTNFLGLQQQLERYAEPNVAELSVGAAWSGSVSPRGGAAGAAGAAGALVRREQRPPFALSPETSDCDSHCDMDSDLSLMLMENELCELKGLSESAAAAGVGVGGLVGVVSMPVVEDGLSSGHASDNDNNNLAINMQAHTSVIIEEIVENGTSTETHVLSDADLHSLDPLVACSEVSPPPPAPAPHRPPGDPPAPPPAPPAPPAAPTAPPAGTPTLYSNRKRPTSAQSTDSVEIKPASGDEDEADTDLETDRLLGQQRTDDQGFFDDKGWRKPKSRTVMPAGGGAARSPRSPHSPHSPHSPPDSGDARDDDTLQNNKDKDGKKKSKNKEAVAPSVLIEGVLFRARYLGSTQLACEGQPTKATRMLQAEEAVSRIKWSAREAGGPYSGVYAPSAPATAPSAPAPAAVFRLTFLGSVEVDEDSRRRRRRPKKNMVEEAVTKIKAPEGENQPSTEVDLFISTEKIMVLNTELKEIMMDHALRTISYIADIGELVVLMARRRFVPHETDSDQPKMNRTPKMICHVFESEEAQFIAQSIGQAFQVAYMEFLKANGIEDHSFVKEMDYQEVLNSQEIFGDELQMFAKKELQKEVVVPKAKGEILGVVVVESGWGSMLPTVVIANLAPAGAAARCGQLNIGDQIIAINGVSLVGLPLSTCQTYIKNSKGQTVVKLTVVPCAPVVEVKIKRPDTKYQLGFSVQNGVICSLLRGGIAERGGVRVGHRIIEINSQSVVAVPHERIVNLLATSVGEILMKTMPTSMFRLLTGQENPVFI